MAQERLDIIVSERGGREVVRTIDGVAESAGAATGALTGLKLAVAGLTNALGVLGFLNASILTPIALLVGGAVAARSAIDTFGEFEAQMNATAVAADATTYQAGLLADAARELSLEWGIANNVVAAGMEDLAKAGVSAQDIIDGAANATIVLAQATGAQLPEAATIAARAMNVFGFAAEDMLYVANQVAGTVNTTTFNLNDYMLALGQAGAIAADQRISFEEFNAGLAAASAYFTSGSDQGTSFRTFLLRLTPVTKEARDAIEELGLEFRDSDGFLLPLADIVDELQEALAGFNDEARTNYLKEIFGEDAYRLAAFYMQQGGDAIREFADEVIPAADAVEMARARLEGLWGWLSRLKSAVSELFLTIMNFGIGDTFTIIIQTATYAVRGLTIALQFLSPIIPFLAARFTLLAGGFIFRGIMALVGGFIWLGRAIVGVFPAVTGLNSLFRLSPFGLVATLALTAGLALVSFADKINLSRDGMVSLQDVAAVVWDDIENGVADMVIGALDWLDALAERGGVSVNQLAEQSDSVWDRMLTKVQDFVKNAIRGFAAFGAFARLAVIRVGDELQGRRWRADDWANALRANTEEAVRDANAWIDSVAQRARGIASERAARDPLAAGTQDRPEEEESGLTRAEFMALENRALQQSLQLLGYNNREREVQSEILRINNQLLDQFNSKLSPEERRSLEETIRLLNERTRVMGEMDNILEGTLGKQEQLINQMRALNLLTAQGGPMVGEYQRQLREVQLALMDIRIQSGQGSFADGFMLELARMVEGTQSAVARMGQSFSNLFVSFADGFATSVARSIVYAEDLGVALQNVARQAVAELIAALIKMGIQWLINATMGQAIAAAMTAASAAQAAALAAAWTPAAVAASLATAGGNATGAIVGMAKAAIAGKALMMAGFKDGGWVSGPGGPRGDAIPAWLSDDEFVVRAPYARRNAGALEAINSGRTLPSGGNLTVPISVTVQQGGTSDGQKTGTEIAREVEKAIVPVLQKHLRPGGVLARR